MISTVRSPGSDELPRPGDILCGKYEIEQIIGSGGMGVVMGAKDSSLGRPVAIKFLSPEKAKGSASSARFLREARAAAAIQSEHVVRIIEVGTLPTGAPFIVMEHLRGADLAHVLARRGPLPIDEACDIILEGCEALAEAHGRGIVHRDLKPQNLFLTERPDGSSLLKVLDFGISKAADDDSSANLTATDTVMGTPLYMSPEQVRSLRDVDARSDIWALGSILFELLTAAPIFEAPTASALCAMIAMDAPTPLRARRAHAPAELEAVILRCLHKDPSGRFADVADFADALAPFASERGRVSAGRIARVVRGSAAPPGVSMGSAPPRAALAALYAPTSTMGPNDVRGAFPSAPSSHPAAMSPSYPPGAGALPSTQTAWDYTGSHRPPPPLRPAREGKIVLGVVMVAGAILVLGLAGGGIALYKRNELAAAIAPGDAPSTLPSPSAPRAAATPAAPLPASQPTAVAPIPAPIPPAKPLAAKDEALARQAEQLCQHHTTILSAARDDAARTRAAQNAKTLTCTKGAQASRCERQVCVNACTILNDRACVDRMNAIISRGPQPKF